MKNYIILILSIAFFSCKAQTNELSIQEFSNIKIDNIEFKEILDTRGDSNQVKSMLDTNLQIETGEEPDYWVQFSFSKYMLLFQDGKKSNLGTVSDYQLTDFLIKDSSIKLSIKGVEIKLGDNIDKLGNPNILTYSDGRKGIVYKIGVQVIQISYDENTNLITKIKYVCYNT